ncbi:MAG: phospholipase C, phosphocholine-specific [Bacteroidota bacterium]
MDSRREFLKKAAILSGAAGLPNVIPMSIQKAMAIDADPNSTFLDAEHVVILMQENRSFDHLFGKLQGVRGFNDPRTFTLPDQDKVWVQKDAEGNAFAPFHVDINKTKITWQGGLPHSWTDQLAARNGGRYDQWIPVKSLMCLAHYDRSDVPFYYAMADAFTICDHNFCSSLTGTTPNRLFMWTGNIKPELTGPAVAAVNNSQAESRDGVYIDWETFPEILEDNGIDWKIYQNEIWTADVPGETVDDWMGNYGDNAIEYVKRYNVKLSAYFRKHGDPKAKLSAAEVTEKYNRLSQREKNLIDKAFASNINAPFNYLELAPFQYKDDQGKDQSLNIPKNDIFYQFRQDVDNGKLPAVSWLVAPQRFSDHTSSPLYGTWYVSEAIDILTKNPEVWKKTIFILTYDENDGYFDHIPPYVAPKPGDASTGKVSAGIDTAADYEFTKDSPIGLGYRVPMLIASPWSKGGYVNSQVFDHTSTIMLLETLFSHKTGKKIRSNMISSWRRAICGDLSSAFRPVATNPTTIPETLKKEQVITSIQNAKNKPAQAKPNRLTAEELASGVYLPRQETGTRKACALPHQLLADCFYKDGIVSLFLASGKRSFGQKLLPTGAPFNVYTTNLFKGQAGKTWAYAVTAGEHVNDEFRVIDFGQSKYDINVSGPNGFFRQFKGDANDPQLEVKGEYELKGFLSKSPSGNFNLDLKNNGLLPLELKIADGYSIDAGKTILLAAGSKKTLLMELSKNSGWYDFTLSVMGNSIYKKQYAGHVEDGNDSITDPLMGFEKY